MPLRAEVADGNEFWLGGAFRMRCPHLVQKSFGTRTSSPGATGVGKQGLLRIWARFRPIHPSQKRRARTSDSHIRRSARKFADNRQRTTSQVLARHPCGLFHGFLCRSKRKPAPRAPHCAEATPELFCLYLLLFC